MCSDFYEGWRYSWEMQYFHASLHVRVGLKSDRDAVVVCSLFYVVSPRNCLESALERVRLAAFCRELIVASFFMWKGSVLWLLEVRCRYRQGYRAQRTGIVRDGEARGRKREELEATQALNMVKRPVLSRKRGRSYQCWVEIDPFE